MSEHAVLGAVDPQVGQHPAAFLLRVVAKKPIEEVDEEILVLADQAEMAVGQLWKSVKELLCTRLSSETCDELALRLSEGRWTHDYPITPEEVRKMGLTPSTAIPEEFLQLMSPCPQPLWWR